MSNVAKRCYEDHPPLVVSDGLVVYGGSCVHPVVPSIDVYVGLDLAMKKSTRRFPWEDGEEILFPISDMRAPSDPVQFKKLLDWLSVQLVAQKKVHIGCLGGHGRTGLVLSALVYVMTGNKDSIRYVRESYCKKVVESTEQVDFLEKHFGILRVEPTKEFHAANQYSFGSGLSAPSGHWHEKPRSRGGLHIPATSSKPAPLAPIRKVLEIPGSMWGSGVVIDKRP